jgi:hypothetical protein
MSFGLFVFPSWLKFFLITEKKIIWFGLGSFLLVHKGFSIAGRVAGKYIGQWHASSVSTSLTL